MTPEEQAFDKWWDNYISEVHEPPRSRSQILAEHDCYWMVKKIAKDCWREASLKMAEICLQASSNTNKEKE